MTKSTKKTRKYKGGGYVIEEKIMPGVTYLEMNPRGFFEEFAKPLLKPEAGKKRKIT